jgi:hypothetical protein
MNNSPWFLLKDGNKLFIQQDEPYVELHVANIQTKRKVKQDYFEVKLNDSIFEINIEFFYCFDGSLELFLSEKQVWKRFEEVIYFVLDSLSMGNYGVIRIAKITSAGQVEVMMQDKIVRKYIKTRID